MVALGPVRCGFLSVFISHLSFHGVRQSALQEPLALMWLKRSITHLWLPASKRGEVSAADHLSSGHSSMAGDLQ